MCSANKDIKCWDVFGKLLLLLLLFLMCVSAHVVCPCDSKPVRVETVCDNTVMSD